jgi:hypothetical protein
MGPCSAGLPVKPRLRAFLEIRELLPVQLEGQIGRAMLAGQALHHPRRLGWSLSRR